LTGRTGIAAGLVLGFFSLLYAQTPISVDELREGFLTRYNKEVVSVRGWTSTEKQVQSRSFKGYYLKDRFGSLLLVRTTNPLPEITSELQVTGIALQDADTSDVYLTETRREIIPSEDKLALERERLANEQREKERRAAEEAAQKRRDQQERTRMIILYAVSGAIIVLVAVGIALTMRRKSAAAPAAQPKKASAAPAAAATPSPSAATIEEFNTVKVYKTTKFLPGKLIIMDKQQETDVIHLSDQTGRGEIEIGRDSPDTTNGIRIKDKSNTLSRRQARLLYSSAVREFKLLNLAGENSNPTVINGRQMAENETAVLKDGDILAMGSLQMKFRQN
jgi:hypothetical protein